MSTTSGKLLRRKYDATKTFFIFQPHVNSTSAPTGKTVNTENYVFRTKQNQNEAQIAVCYVYAQTRLWMHNF